MAGYQRLRSYSTDSIFVQVIHEDIMAVHLGALNNQESYGMHCSFGGYDFREICLKLFDFTFL